MKKIDSFKNRLAKALSNRQMKAIELSRKTGINKSLISNYLKGGYEAKYGNLTAMAKALDVNEVWLLGYDVPMNNEDAINKEETKGTENTYTNDIMDYELAKKMIQVLLDFEKPISTKRAYKIIDIAKSMVLDLAIIYYKD